MINRARFDRTLNYVRRSQVHDHLERALRINPGGRPRALDVDVLLTAFMLCYLEHNTVAMTKVHQLLTTDLSRNLQVELGIRASTTAAPITIRQVRYIWNRITNLFDSSGVRKELPRDIRRKKAAGELEPVINDLISEVTRHIGTTGRYAVDATAVESAARGKRRNRDADAANDWDCDLPADARRIHDREARWGYRTKTYDNKTNSMFGYQMTAFARIGAVGGGIEPLLVERIHVLPGNQAGIPETLATIDQMSEAGVKVAEIVADRGYSYKSAEDWAIPLNERGIAQVLDMHDNDRGARLHPQHGYVMIDGWAHCPSIPDHLVRIPRPPRFSIRDLKPGATPEEKAEHADRTAALTEFNRLIDERATYRFERLANPRDGRGERFRCPARAGKLKCNGCPLAEFLPEGTPQVDAPEGELPKACKQESITIKAETNIKLRQAEYWGSPEWQASNGRRSRVEGGFGLLKAPLGGNIKRGWTRQVGLAKTTMLLAIAVAATNLDQLIKWAADTADTRDPLTQVDVTDHGFVELNAHGGLASGVSPPLPA